MQTYDNPTKNWVRKQWFSAIDQHFAKNTGHTLHALYLPGEQNLEWPHYKTRRIKTFPIERDGQILSRLCDPQISHYPLKRNRVFYGTIREFVCTYVQKPFDRLDLAFLDFKGKIETIADELLSIFHLFPASRGGLLGITVFSAMDEQTVREGIVFANALDRILDGIVLSQIDALFEQIRLYLEQYGDPHSLCHGQFCRDFGLLWRIMLGMGLVNHPNEGFGTVNSTFRAELFPFIAPLHEEALRLYVLSESPAFFRLNSKPNRACFEKVNCVLYPISLKRFIYKSLGEKRMSTWYLFFSRLQEPVPLVAAIEQLWNLYRRSPLVFVDDEANRTVYRPQ